MMPRPMAASLVASVLLTVHLHAQAPEPEALDFNRPESWAMKYYAMVNLFTADGPPPQLEQWRVQASFEGIYVPQLSEEERRVGFDGEKVEDLNKTNKIGRPRVTVGLPWRWSVTGSYVPPIEVFDIEPELYAFSLQGQVAEVAGLDLRNLQPSRCAAPR